MRKIVLDTSVVTKWFSQKQEQDLPAAFHILELIQQDQIQVICPRIILLELANVLFFGKGVSQNDCLQAVLALRDLCSQLVDELNLPALTELMYKSKLTSYDTVFVNLAEEYRLPLVTADYKHHQKSVSPNIVWLAEFD